MDILSDYGLAVDQKIDGVGRHFRRSRYVQGASPRLWRSQCDAVDSGERDSKLDGTRRPSDDRHLSRRSGRRRAFINAKDVVKWPQFPIAINFMGLIAPSKDYLAYDERDSEISFRESLSQLEKYFTDAKHLRRDFSSLTHLCMMTRSAFVNFASSYLTSPKQYGKHVGRLKDMLNKAAEAVAQPMKKSRWDPSEQQIAATYLSSIQQRIRFTEILEREGVEGLERVLPSDDAAPAKYPQLRDVRVAYLDDRHYQWLLEDPTRLYSMSCEQFEELVADRLSAMGFEVQLVGRTNWADGGVDIVAWPRASVPFPFLIATQVKHHRSKRPTGVGEVRDFCGTLTMNNGLFSMGAIVTNTTFTDPARWFADRSGALLRLRDLRDLCRWMSGDFVNPLEWREIPKQIELAPGVIVKVPNRSNKELQLARDVAKSLTKS